MRKYLAYARLPDDLKNWRAAADKPSWPFWLGVGAFVVFVAWVS